MVQEGWINIDLAPRPGVIYFNVLNALPVDDQTVAHIHAEHLLEHLEYVDAIFFLGECHRVLEIGGSIRIVVPDAERYMRAYVENDKEFFERLDHLGGTPEPLPTKGAICNQMFRMGGDHRFAWDLETIEYTARRVGFRSVRKSSHNDSSAPHCIDGQDSWRPIESLYVNLIR
jgi:predicted SAM-dependent methyltransferase